MTRIRCIENLNKNLKISIRFIGTFHPNGWLFFYCQITNGTNLLARCNLAEVWILKNWELYINFVLLEL